MTITQAINRLAFIAALLLVAPGAYALTAVEAKGIAIGEGDARIESLNKALATAD